MLTNVTNETILEQNLKDLLQSMLNHLEGMIETEDELYQIQSNLKDYENLQDLVETIQIIFNTLIQKYNNKEPEQKYFKCEGNQQNYMKLEQMIQKHEQEIRNHIRIEHELKLYSEQIQQQLEESEQVRAEYLEQTTQIIQKLKKENHELSQQLKSQTKQSQQLSKIGSLSLQNLIIKQQAKYKMISPSIPNQLNYLNNRKSSKEQQQSLSSSRPQQKNQSYSMGVSKQTSMSNSFNKEQLSRMQNKKSFHTDMRHRFSIDRLKLQQLQQLQLQK